MGGGGRAVVGTLSRELVCFLLLAYLTALMALTLACAGGWREKVQRHFIAFVCHLLLSFYRSKFKNWLFQWQIGQLLKKDTENDMQLAGSMKNGFMWLCPAVGSFIMLPFKFSDDFVK